MAARDLDSPVGLSQTNPSLIGFESGHGEWAGYIHDTWPLMISSPEKPNKVTGLYLSQPKY